MTESFLTRLHSRQPLLGTLITLPAPEIAEIFVEAGFDWLFIDLEHSPLGPGQAQALIQAAAGRAACIIRVPLNDEVWIKKVLDLGAAGVMVPLVNTPEEARRAVRLSKYPPQGTRSVGIGRAQGYGARLQEYLERANAETAVIIQVEHIQAVENIEAILQVEGIDAVLVGPYDLSASLNRMGQVGHPEVQAAVAHVRQACLARGMALGAFAATPEKARDYLAQGFTLVASASDTLMLVQSSRAALQSLRK